MRVVFSASSLGTMELLFRLKENGSLPRISSRLGKHVRTNSESIIGARVPRCAEDLSQGIAIGSGIYIDEHTHIEAVRYPSGSDAMGLLTTMLTDGRPGFLRIGLWVKNMLSHLLLSPDQDFSSVSALGLGPGSDHPALHASAGGAHRDAVATAVVLAVFQNAGEPRR